MRALALSIWLFINLIFFGMCGYMYLLWSQYWIATEKEDEVTTNKYDQQIYYYNRGYSSNASTKSHGFPEAMTAKNRTKHSTKGNVTVIRNSKPRFPNVQPDEFPMDTQRYKCLNNDSTSQCDCKVAQFKEKIINELKKVFLEEGNVLKSQANYYNVYYDGFRGNYVERNPKDILCQLSKLNLPTLAKKDVPEGLYGLRNALPRGQLFQNSKFNSCAIVSSAGSLKGSSLGEFIDSHKLVMRFNNAPTYRYEKDVGMKTDFRILNSQVMSKPEYRFVQADIYQNMTILGWDPSNYGESIADWLSHPEFNLFYSYMEYRKKNTNRSRVYILNPESIWNVWDFLQSVSPNRIRRNPPSSGFLGISILLPHCDFIDVFEYMPSVRVTKKCHYYDPEDNPSCTFGVWHPLAAEKLLSYYVNVADDKTVFQTGYIRIPGPSKLGC